MALAPLATAADLDVKGVEVTNTELVNLMLAAASSVIRDAAGSTISQATSTISVLAPQGRWLTLPGPVTAVTSVLIDGTAVTDWKLVGGLLWRACGWAECEPVPVTVAFTHGLVEVPADIVNLCADLAKLGIEAASDEPGTSNVLPASAVSASYAIDDYTERIQYAEDPRSLMELADVTKAWLASRFGSGVYVTSEQQ
jgi:hypothetical protein